MVVDSMCSMLSTTVVRMRSKPVVKRPSISSGFSPVNCQATATTGILIFGKMSVGVRWITTGLASRINIARTIKVYGRLSASLTIHILPSPYCLLIGERCQSERKRSFTLELDLPCFLVTTLLAIDVPTSPSIGETLWAMKLNKLLPIVAEREEEALPLFRQMTKYGRCVRRSRLSKAN